MSFKIVRNDITRMNTEAIVNTANRNVLVGPGCDSAVYKAAGYDKLLAYRKEHIGIVDEGEAFITPGFDLPASYIIHAVSPMYLGGDRKEESKLRSCYSKSLQLAKEKGIRSIAFPLISTGSFGYPKEEGMRIAVDEINAFLLQNDMDIFLVVFDGKATSLGRKIYAGLESYIDRAYVESARDQEYGSEYSMLSERNLEDRNIRPDEEARLRRRNEEIRFGREIESSGFPALNERISSPKADRNMQKLRPDDGTDKKATAIFNNADDFPKPSMDYRVGSVFPDDLEELAPGAVQSIPDADDAYFDVEEHEGKIKERLRHLSDTYSEYLMYLIKEKNMENADVYKRAIVDKKIFSKIKNNPEYHPKKITALCLCVGARLNLDESRDLLARAGYALSPCDKTDIIFSYFIEHKIYDMIELDIQLEEHGLPCIIS